MLTFLDIFEICSMVQRLTSYNLLSNKKGLKKQFTDELKKGQKKYWKIGIELFIDDNAKSLQIYNLHSFRAYQKKIVEFTD